MTPDNSITARRKRGALALKATSLQIKRFFARAKPAGDCLLIGKNTSIYTRVEISKDVFMPAHRFALICYTKEHHPNKYACHTCLKKNCIAKAHLYWGTPKQNAADMDLHGTRRAPYSITGYRRPITQSVARQIAIEFMKHEKSLPELAEDFKVTHTIVRNIMTRRSWKDATSDLNIDRIQRARYYYGPYGEYHQHSKINDKTAKKIITLAAEGMTVAEIARKLKISQGITKDVRSGATWSHLARPPSIITAKAKPPVAVSKKLARHIYTSYHWHGHTLAEISSRTGVPRSVISRINQKRRQAEHTEGLKSRQHIGHKNRAENRNLPGVKLCEICKKPFDYKAMGLKSRKKTCSVTCLGESRRRTVSRTHAEGRMPYTKEAPRRTAPTKKRPIDR